MKSNEVLDFLTYQAFVGTTGLYPMMGKNIVYPALGLAGEAGEVADKVKKLWRNRGVTAGCDLTDEEREKLALELGDALWYVVALAKEIGYDLDTIAIKNIAKLQDRKNRGVIASEGDNR
jgi:NTP pyrophosphatase (non-canonical NTP hydrolase)